MPGLRFTPQDWGPGVFVLEAPTGQHVIVRRHRAPDLAFWLPTGLAPAIGDPFGLYLHADRHHRDRMRAAGLLTRSIGRKPSKRRTRHPQAHRLVAMLYVHDLISLGASLREVAEVLLDPVPDNWRMSSERSDLRRLADAGAKMVAGDYRSLL